MPTKAELGRRLRVARFERDLTLKEVAARCGMSATHISEVERGKTSPTIGALQRIAGALGEKTSYFVQEDEFPRVRLTKLEDRRDLFQADVLGTPFQVQVVAEGIPSGYMQLFRHTMAPGAKLDGYPRIGEAFVLCTKGMTKIVVDGESHVLREGDAMQLRLDNGYFSENIGDEESETLGVLVGPALLNT